MTEYKDTLNLPKTAFPMKANLANREPQMLKRWYDEDLYGQIRQHRQGQDKFIMHDGPPYANGSLHCGHALNKILKDIVVKAKTLSGFDAPFIPGWDCHGLPIELNVEKKHGKAGRKLSYREFRQKCRDYANSQVDIQRNEFKRFGVLADWDKPYITMDHHYEANIIRALGKIIEHDHLKQGFKPVHWCLDCQSALAEAEVEYEDKSSPSIDVRFFVVDKAKLIEAFAVTDDIDNDVSLPIWTTTPWTLPANQGVALNAELDYALVKNNQGGECIVIANELVESVTGRYGWEEHQTLAHAKGEKLEGVLLKHPLFAKEVSVLLGEHVTTEAGTGCVHTAPAHGPDDYLLGLKYDLALDNPVMSNGCYAETVEHFAGLYVAKADKPIIEYLKEKALLLSHEKIMHSYPHCWRHKTPIIFRATPQWFISFDKAGLRDKALNAIKETQWIPNWGQARIEGMTEKRPDWCISRQRAWGVPIPLFVHKETGALHPKTPSLIEKVASLVEKEGIDAWFELEPQQLLGDDVNDYTKVGDTLDVWFDSGVSHYAVLKANPNLQWPADLYLEGSDQHRGWFNSSLSTACAIEGVAPYKTVLTHGFVVDANGHKMSKSKGNYIAPEKLINKTGVDILRLWVSSTDYKGDVNLSEEILKRTSDAYRRIRNTCRFLLANLFDFDPKAHLIDADKMVALDKWAIKKTKLLQQEIIEAYNNYDFHVIYQKIHNFCAIDMGSFYLDIIKDRQYTTPTDSHPRRSCQSAIYHIVESLVRWLTPILSFTADEVWGYIPGEREDSVFISHWYEAIPEVDDIDLAYWDTLIAVRDEINKAIEKKRNSNELGSGLEAHVRLYVSGDLFNQLNQLKDELRFLLITSSATVLPLSDKTKIAEESDIDGLFIAIAAATSEKCQRCWHRLEDVGQHETHPSLCQRCIGNISDNVEVREFA